MLIISNIERCLRLIFAFSSVHNWQAPLRANQVKPRNNIGDWLRLWLRLRLRLVRHQYKNNSFACLLSVCLMQISRNRPKALECAQLLPNPQQNCNYSGTVTNVKIHVFISFITHFLIKFSSLCCHFFNFKICKYAKPEGEIWWQQLKQQVSLQEWKYANVCRRVCWHPRSTNTRNTRLWCKNFPSPVYRWKFHLNRWNKICTTTLNGEKELIFPWQTYFDKISIFCLLFNGNNNQQLTVTF